MLTTPIPPRPCRSRGPGCCASCCNPNAAGTAVLAGQREPICVECWHKLASREQRRKLLALGWVVWTLAALKEGDF